MITTLGISCFYHDSAAAIIRDGEIIAAAQEERFSRRKGDPSFPLSAINYCLEEAEIAMEAVDSVVYYDKPLLSFERVIKSYLSAAPWGLRSWLSSAPVWISQKLHIRKIISETLQYNGNILFSPHHLSHAASAYFPSPYDDAAILTIDGVGEWATASYGIGEGEKIKLLKEMRFPDSLGLLYSAFTLFSGFKVNSGEYKLMGLAPYGEPNYLNLIKEHIAAIEPDGTVVLNMSYFGFLDSLKMTSGKFEKLFGGPPRKPESRITKREMDIASSIQKFTEEAMLNMVGWVYKETGKRKLCMAGGVALNCVANGRILREGPFEDIWIQPAAGDAGGALGAALAVQFGCHEVKRPRSGVFDKQKGSYLGPNFSEEEVSAFLTSNNIPHRRLEEHARPGIVAKALHENNIVGFFSGKMEFGPRSLGARSIIGNPLREDTQRTMNLKIKYRESFRPFAPAVLAEDAKEYFELERQSPYMLIVAPVKKERCILRQRQIVDDDLLNAVNQQRSDIPSVTHWDYSARIQTVHKETNPVFYEVLKAFKELSGYALVVNTSFNVRGEPIVCTPEDAYRCFMRTEMNALYLEGFWLDKREQPILKESVNWKDIYGLD
jgi:carbamoyltransferase